MTRPIHFQTPGERHVELIPWTDQDLDNLSQITTDDMDRAESYWKRRLPKSLRDLLSAVVSAVHLLAV
jgi:hypothetical protein